jgi:hypothetical protein
VRLGPLRLGALGRGEARRLTAGEVEALRAHAARSRGRTGPRAESASSPESD